MQQLLFVHKDDDIEKSWKKLDVKVMITDVDASSPFLLSPGLLLDFKPKSKSEDEKKDKKKKSTSRYFHAVSQT